MSITLGLVANVFNEVNALPGWLETHLPYFNDVREDMAALLATVNWFVPPAVV